MRRRTHTGPTEPVSYTDRSKLVVPPDGDTFEWLSADPYRAALKPWSFPSIGHTIRYPCDKSQRPLTLFSRLELVSAQVHERRPDVVEVFDQVPLLPTSRVRWYARRLGMHSYPREGTFASTDLVLRVRQGSRTWWEAVAVKPEKELKKGRVRLKLEIERLFWHDLNVPWRLDTDTSYDEVELSNLQFLAPSRRFEHFMPLDRTVGDAILEAVGGALLGPPLSRLCDALAAVDRKFGARPGTAMSGLRWALATGRYSIPFGCRISPTMPLESLIGDAG